MDRPTIKLGGVTDEPRRSPVVRACFIKIIYVATTTDLKQQLAKLISFAHRVVPTVRLGETPPYIGGDNGPFFCTDVLGYWQP
jgi:hypothetical protein